MSANDEREFDKLLSDHLGGELNPQLGRASRAFDEMIRQQRGRHQRLFALTSGVSLLAASIVLAIWLWPASPPTNHSNVLVERTSPIDPPPRDVDHLVAWQTFDEGVQNIRVDDKALPVYRLRQEAIQQVEWFDPSDKSTVRVMVPRQQVLLIAQETY
jgi:hypothetical protein